MTQPEEKGISPMQLAYELQVEGKVLVPGKGLANWWYTKVNPIGTDGMTRTGRWMQEHVWGEYSPTACRITNAVDGLPDRPRLVRLGGLVTEMLGTGNYFS